MNIILEYESKITEFSFCKHTFRNFISISNFFSTAYILVSFIRFYVTLLNCFILVS